MVFGVSAARFGIGALTLGIRSGICLTAALRLLPSPLPSLLDGPLQVEQL
jgi:hypothetical protein